MAERRTTHLAIIGFRTFPPPLRMDRCPSAPIVSPIGPLKVDREDVQVQQARNNFWMRVVRESSEHGKIRERLSAWCTCTKRVLGSQELMSTKRTDDAIVQPTAFTCLPVGIKDRAGEPNVGARC